ncbi:hypothetical protein Fmac_028116 [Flemingia macrophylla]|uniref:Uncharacterized protein n=1 Tax=Flemingia macrophylla TaxID=520843 RepID=A0ABD1LJN6_9FABA
MLLFFSHLQLSLDGVRFSSQNPPTLDQYNGLRMLSNKTLLFFASTTLRLLYNLLHCPLQLGLHSLPQPPQQCHQSF